MSQYLWFNKRLELAELVTNIFTLNIFLKGFKFANQLFTSFDDLKN